MAPLVVRIDLTFTNNALRNLLALGMMFLAVGELGSESVVLNTYYPAPSGIYDKLIATGEAYLARDPGDGQVGINTGATPLPPVDPTENVRLTVGGSVKINQNLNVAGRLGVGTPPTAQTFTTAGTGGFTGSLGVGAAIPGARLDVVGGPIRSNEGVGLNQACRIVAYAATGATSCAASEYATFHPGVWAQWQISLAPTVSGGSMYCCNR